MTKHRRQSAGYPTEDQNIRSWTADSSFKRFSGMKDEEISPGGHISASKDSPISRIERKVDRLEDLVWRLYEELDNKIQDLFDEHTAKFKEQNDIISNIFHNFGSEINVIKDEIQTQKFISDNSKSKFMGEEVEVFHAHDAMDEEEKRLIQYGNTQGEIVHSDTLEEVIEETSKGKNNRIINRMNDRKQRRK